MTPQVQPDNLPEIFNEKEQTFLALLAQEPEDNIRSVGRKMVKSGIYQHEKSAHCLLRNPVVRAEFETIKSIKRENAAHVTIKSVLLTDRELDRIAKMKVGTLEISDERWIDRGFKASPPEIAQANVQINIEDRLRSIKTRVEAAKAAGGKVLVKQDT